MKISPTLVTLDLATTIFRIFWGGREIKSLYGRGYFLGHLKNVTIHQGDQIGRIYAY
jgi:hypothetical protein